MDEVLRERTRHFTIALEDIYQPQNASAVIRSCDCFGVQEFYVIENKNKYKLNYDVTRGASNWVDIYRYKKRNSNNTLDCISELKKKGYKIVATTPHKDDYCLDEIPINEKLALFFGNEADGLSEDVINNADYFLKVPMVGFTESLNLSVCAAICLYQLTQRLRASELDFRLSESEMEELKYQWVKRIVKRADLLEQEYINRAKISQG